MGYREFDEREQWRKRGFLVRSCERREEWYHILRKEYEVNPNEQHPHSIIKAHCLNFFTSRYVVHCSQHAGVTGEDYLTPTQRAHKQVKRLRVLLQKAQHDLEQKDSDIIKLTKEVVELRLYKAALNSPEDKSNSSDAVTVRENIDEQVTPITTDHQHQIDGNNVGNNAVGNHIGGMTCSYADSGHFEDFTNSSVHSKDSVHLSDDYVQSVSVSQLRKLN